MDNIILEIGLALALVAFAVALAQKLGLSNVPFLIIIVNLALAGGLMPVLRKDEGGGRGNRRGGRIKRLFKEIVQSDTG